MTRVFALWQQMSGHSAAGFRALVSEGATLRMLYRSATPEAPYDDGALVDGLDARAWADQVDDAVVREELEAFQPDVVLVCSWNVGAYRRAMHRWRGRAVRVVIMDNQWHGTAKQWAGRLGRRVIIAPSFDAAFVTGERQATFARHLGFNAGTTLWGAYTCDDAFFTGPQETPRPRFVYAGRLVRAKGIDVLAAAYRSYRDSTDAPWPLSVAGTGPLGAMLEDIPGVEMLGFVSPPDLPAVLSTAGCLVLPSRFEPWGVVVHEAVASGLSVICTEACGASTRLVLDGLNGRVIATGDEDALRTAMASISGATPARRASMSVASANLASQLTPARWAQYVLERTDELSPRLLRR